MHQWSSQICSQQPWLCCIAGWSYRCSKNSTLDGQLDIVLMSHRCLGLVMGKQAFKVLNPIYDQLMRSHFPIKKQCNSPSFYLARTWFGFGVIQFRNGILHFEDPKRIANIPTLLFGQSENTCNVSEYSPWNTTSITFMSDSLLFEKIWVWSFSRKDKAISIIISFIRVTTKNEREKVWERSIFIVNPSERLLFVRTRLWHLHTDIGKEMPISLTLSALTSSSRGVHGWFGEASLGDEKQN